MPRTPFFAYLLIVFAAFTVALSPAAEAKNHHNYDWDNWHYRHDGWRERDRVVVVAPPVTNYYGEREYYDDRYPPQGDYRVSCARDNTVPALLGAGLGAAIGTQIGHGSGRTAAIIAGALLGGAAGSNYTYGDRYCTEQVFTGTPVGTPYSWRNYDTGYDYTVTPLRDYRYEGRQCREYTATVRVNGRLEESYGTACRQPDGSWQIMN